MKISRTVQLLVGVLAGFLVAALASPTEGNINGNPHSFLDLEETAVAPGTNHVVEDSCYR